MGDGKNLKKYLDEKGTNVRKIAKATGNQCHNLIFNYSKRFQYSI